MKRFLATVRFVVPAFVVSAAFAAVTLSATAANAQPRKAEASPALNLAPAIQKLKSGDEGQIRQALDEIRIAGAGGRSAGPAVAELLSRGVSAPLTEAALETLADIEADAASNAIAPYLRHRNVKIRRIAAKVLARTHGPVAATALRRSLADSDSVVRGVSASGLGAARAKDAVPDLFTALDHRVNEAAAAIGQLCAGEQCTELTARLGKLPFDVVVSGLEPVLFRPAGEVSDDMKIKILGKIRELGTAEANKFLKDAQARAPAAWSPRLKQALEQAVRATAGGAQ